MTNIEIRVSGAAAVKGKQDGLLTAGMVGATVRFSFDGLWDGLSKTAVFKCGGMVRDVIGVEDTARIPAEVLCADTELYVGVEGRSGDGAVVIPTVWVRAAYVYPGANASGDLSTDLTLPVWAQIQAMIGDLAKLHTADKSSLVAAINEALRSGGSAVDEDTVARLVAEYLEANPPAVKEADPTVPDWAKQPEKPKYTADEVGALSQGKLQAGINLALEQAKTSGVFDGAPGKSAYQYALDGGYTGTEEEFAQDLAVDKITAPNTARVGQTIVVKEVDEEGKPVSWECADVGGGSGDWKKLRAFSVPTDPSADTSGITWITNDEGGVIGFEFDTDADGNGFECYELSITTAGSCADDGGAIGFYAQDSLLCKRPGYQNTGSRCGWGELQKRNGVWRWIGAWAVALRFVHDSGTISTTGFSGGNALSSVDAITTLRIQGDAAFNAGYSFNIWGRCSE